MFCQLKISLDDLPNARGTCDPLSVAMIADESAVKTTDAADSAVSPGIRPAYTHARATSSQQSYRAGESDCVRVPDGVCLVRSRTDCDTVSKAFGWHCRTMFASQYSDR